MQYINFPLGKEMVDGNNTIQNTSNSDVQRARTQDEPLPIW